MSRLSVTAYAVLITVVLVQGWLLLDRRESVENRSAPQSGAGIDPLPDSVGDSDPMHAVSMRLAAIDRRLASLERVPLAPTGQGRGSAQQVSVSPQAAAMADRRIASMFPGNEFDGDDMTRFQTTLAAMPAEEQLAFATAFSRAVNSNRIKPRL